MQFEGEFFLHILMDKLEQKQRDRERFCRQGDLRKIDMALGAEDLVRELKRDFQFRVESVVRMQEQQKAQALRREFNKRQRQLERAAAKECA